MSASANRADLAFYPWHVRVWEQLGASLLADRFPHALLFEGQSGTGRNAFATTLARILLCDLSEPNDAAVCASCKSCDLLTAGSNPDFLSVYPEEKGKSLGIDQIRRAIDFANKTSALGKGKVIVISPAESMTRGASNALLKCLEEPSSGTVLILVSKPGAFIPATIRSRCQRWVLPAPTHEQTAAWLRDELPELGSATLNEWMHLCPARPIDIKGLVVSDSGEHWLALHRALAAAGAQHSQDASSVANSIAMIGAKLSIDEYLDLFESRLQALIKGGALDEAGHGPGRSVGHVGHVGHVGREHESMDDWEYSRKRQAFHVLDELRALRLAHAGGSNPQADLLKFNLARQLMALGER
ncbi:MAG: DNA polymerase III subunit delta' [Pseudomonadota bacterium]